MKFPKFTEAQKREFIELFPTTSNKELAEKFGVTINFVARKGCKLKLKKTKEYKSLLSKTPNAGQFKKGNISHNQGKKLSEETKEKIKNFMFKKGNKPHNARKIGDEYTDKDGYLWVKTEEPNVWKLKHHLAFNEPIPKNMYLIFIDGNKRNFDKSNLQLISQAENMRRNTIHRYPDELISLIRVTKKLTRKIAEVQNA